MITKKYFKNGKLLTGFTLIEIIIVIAILSAIAAIVVFNFPFVKKKSDLDNSVKEFVSVLELARNKTISSEGDSRYGVHLNTAVSPNQYVLFKGESYADRDVPADVIYCLPDTTEFYDINLGEGNEIVFDRPGGGVENSGSVSERIKSDAALNKTVYIASSGLVSFNLPVTPPGSNRVIDSRHVYFNYSRTIDTVNENIILTFDGTITKTIPISSNLSGGEIEWSGVFDVGGENQALSIKTHSLNNPDMYFSIHRDRRYNNKSLKITISGDSSGSLAEYPADGTDANFSSAYVSGFIKI